VKLITVDNGGSVSITATAVRHLYDRPITTTLTTLPSPEHDHPEVAASLPPAARRPTCCRPQQPWRPRLRFLHSAQLQYRSSTSLPFSPAERDSCRNRRPGYGTISIDVSSTLQTPTYTRWQPPPLREKLRLRSALFSVTLEHSSATPSCTCPHIPIHDVNHLSVPHPLLGSDQGLMYVDSRPSNLPLAWVSNTRFPERCPVRQGCSPSRTMANWCRLRHRLHPQPGLHLQWQQHRDRR